MPHLTVFKSTLFLAFLGLLACRNSAGDPSGSRAETESQMVSEQNARPIVGANRTREYFPLLKNKRIGLVANQTSVIFKEESMADAGLGWVHLADSLLNAGMDLKKVFAPEHGFRGAADAGETFEDGKDAQTGLPIISLYGKNRKPAPENLKDLDIVLFDIQDVGVRFYTYIATLQLVMEACAAAEIPLVVLDRPNPNAHFVDGPLMEAEHRSFLGMTQIPLVYGMTIGEYAQMINDEGWLEGGLKADLLVIPIENYNRNIRYSLPIAPSPNLPNDQAIRLYPSLGLFEGTTVNAGRGTAYQFQCFGAPYLNPDKFGFTYTPQPNAGAKYPKQQGKLCYGMDLRDVDPPKAVDLSWLVSAYQNRGDSEDFFITSGFTRHAGTAVLQQQIEAGESIEEIRSSWEPGIRAFKQIRSKYLIYPGGL
ncbi:exo-beta-N-acetylmuramidase NamZ family protein [Robiginitalea sp. IMCC43444]|uniref:exo-beta-N-acetylmuramidase NamZ family protein n=1 Tax=Robiginitalea sp. IMCC43444 TaxID=3459121 RepID=UPI0040412CBB